MLPEFNLDVVEKVQIPAPILPLPTPGGQVVVCRGLSNMDLVLDLRTNCPLRGCLRHAAFSGFLL